MNSIIASYAPRSAESLVWLLAMLLIAVSTSLFLPRLRAGVARPGAWIVLIGGIIAADQIFAAEGAGFRMLAFVGFGLLAMKAIVIVEEQASGMPRLPIERWLAFSVAWLGMRPRLFEVQMEPVDGGRELIRHGFARLAAGLVLVLLARVCWVALESRVLSTALLLVGISLMLHFGLCNLLAGSWRLRQVPCNALFVAPLRSRSLNEFWSKRWNLAFSEMTSIAVYRPLAQHLGRNGALIVAFTFSGLLHEMAISLPVRAGFGLPLLYFALHGVLVLIERQHPRASFVGTPWVIFWLVAPMPLLFHPPFLRGVVWPLIGIGPGS
jgi:alginate O-acetyltransferase complex protein AlgI